MRENTPSGRLQEPMHIGSEGAKRVAEAMRRDEKPQGTSNGMKFAIITENQAHCAKRTLPSA